MQGREFQEVGADARALEAEGHGACLERSSKFHLAGTLGNEGREMVIKFVKGTLDRRT